MKDIAKAISLAVLLLIFSSCEKKQDGTEEAQFLKEQQSEKCRNRICDGEVLPAYDARTELPFKVGGKFFIGPKEYGAFNGVFAFFWPSKTPANSVKAKESAPEFIPSSAGVTSNFYEVAIELFLRSDNIPTSPHGYRLIQLAEEKDWIKSRRILAPGLEVIQMKHVIGPNDHFIDHIDYFVATDLKGIDGLPPVAGCNQTNPANQAGAGFFWRDGIWVGIRMKQKHCSDWPQIYQEIVRVLSLIRKP